MTTPWLTIHTAALYASVAKQTLYRAVRAGRLQHVRLGPRGDLRFRPEWIDAWLTTAAGTQPAEN